MKIQSTKNKSNFGKLLENLPKYLHIDFQIWFPKYKFKNSKYIKNVEVHSLRTPGLVEHRYLCKKPPLGEIL